MKGFPLKLIIGSGFKKIERWGYRAEKEVWSLSALWIQYANIMDRQTPDDSKDRAYDLPSVIIDRQSKKFLSANVNVS